MAGEASGDLHGSNLMQALKTFDSSAQFRCWGGDKMKAAGGELVKHYRDLAFMGFVEVLQNLPAIFRNLSFCKSDIEYFQPDVIVLIDYPGFNLRIAKWAKEKGFKVVYYISPQVWAWKENRVKLIKQSVDKMLVIFPFEQAFYEKWNYPVEYVGHPLLKVVDDFKANHLDNQQQKIVAVLPGSRKQEVASNLSVMLSVVKDFPQYKFVLAKAPSLSDSFYEAILQGHPQIETVSNDTYNLLQKASAALVTSGTATLETALFGVPQIVCYKGNPISYAIAKRILTIKFICIVNLILDKEVVKELIQHELNAENIRMQLDKILHNEKTKKQIQSDYSALKKLLLKGGDASMNAAASIYSMLNA